MFWPWQHHGKTTVAAMLAWILEQAGRFPGFLIGGVPLDFPVSARLTGSPLFVIEADEYDTAFFDKRSKFVHYRPRTAILNNWSSIMPISSPILRRSSANFITSSGSCHVPG